MPGIILIEATHLYIMDNYSTSNYLSICGWRSKLIVHRQIRISNYRCIHFRIDSLVFDSLSRESRYGIVGYDNYEHHNMHRKSNSWTSFKKLISTKVWPFIEFIRNIHNDYSLIGHLMLNEVITVIGKPNHLHKTIVNICLQLYIILRLFF